MTTTRTGFVTLLAALTVGLTATPALANPEDPCFRQDPECYGQGYAPQLPEETNGRAIDCPDGQVGYMQYDMVICPPPVAPAPAPTAAAPTAAAPTAAPATPAQAPAPRLADQGVDAPVTVDTAPAPVVAGPVLDVAALVAWIRDFLLGISLLAAR